MDTNHLFSQFFNALENIDVYQMHHWYYISFCWLNANRSPGWINSNHVHYSCAQSNPLYNLNHSPSVRRNCHQTRPPTTNTHRHTSAQHNAHNIPRRWCQQHRLIHYSIWNSFWGSFHRNHIRRCKLELLSWIRWCCMSCYSSSWELQMGFTTFTNL